MKWKKGVALLWLLVLLTGCASGQAVMTAAEDKGGAEESVTVPDAGTEQIRETDIYVYVCGYVERPGVYQLPPDARICDALALAGGVSEDGRAEALDQAEHMSDGQTIYVPGREEQVKEADDGLLNINTATKEELMTLPGIGEAKAGMILQYREEHGTFQAIEELMEIQGIKEGVFNKIKGYIKAH